MNVQKKRTVREQLCIQARWLEKLSVEQFLEIFGRDLRNSDARTEKEVLCEKAFLLESRGNFFAIQKFMELLEDEECRYILSEKYHFELQDFYEINADE